MADPDRRGVSAGLAGILALAACAPLRRPPQVQVNLAQTTPPPTGTPGGDNANLLTGEDNFDRLTAPVRINGEGPFSFVIDTGANRTVVSEELAAALSLPDAGMTQVHGIAGAELHRTVLVHSLDADAVHSSSIRAPTLPRARLGVDGLLGVDVLRGRLVTLDFVHQRLRIGPGLRPDDSRTPFDMREEGVGRNDNTFGAPIVVPAQYRFGQLIIVDAEVRERPLKAFLDSGSQSTVANMMMNRLVLNSPDPHAPVASRLVTSVLSATGQTAEGEVGDLPPLRIGGLTINGMRVVYADLHVFELWRLLNQPAILIGIDVMRRFAALQIDFAGRQVLFYPNGVLPVFRE